MLRNSVTGFQIPVSRFQIPVSRFRIPETQDIRYQNPRSGPTEERRPDPDQDTRFQAPAGRASALRRQMPRNQIPRSQRRPSGPGGPGQSPTYQSPGTGAAPEAAEGGAGAQVPKSGEGEEGREAEGQGGGGRTPGSLVLMKETQETGPEIPPEKLVFPSLVRLGAALVIYAPAL